MMTKIAYNWKRFWYPRETPPALTDGGYLMDPEARWGSYINPSAQSFEALADTPCLVLLGEPGIGKTTALTAEHAEHQRSRGDTGDTILWVDLPRYQSEERLYKALFEQASFQEWQAGSQRLYLFLDGLDECLMRMNTVADVLIEGLKQSSYERIFLRIACRTADWPLGFEEQLTQLWGDQSVKAYELAPLRRKDVVAAATTHQIDANLFLAEIDRAEAVPLAIKPVTLQMLINIYLASGALPSSRQELYEQGCLLLCEETNQHRQDTRLTGRFTADQRLAAAERIAAVTEFAYRYAIWVDVDLGNVPPADVRVRELLSASLDEQKTVEPAIQEALATGLFSARGPQELGWAHQTYAEFLAARFLVSRKMSLRQIMSLLTHPGDPNRKLVPQLHEVAAWLAGVQPEVFRAILSAEPEVLLHSDVTTATHQDRAALAAALLQFYTDEHALYKDWSLPKYYHKLAHPGLAEQLRPVIGDPSVWLVTRRVAIEIAEACREHSLQEDLVGVALDITQSSHLRATAVGALAHTGDASAKQAIKPLLHQSAHDPDDNIKGQCLMALWPDALTAADLFAVLTPSQREFHVGAYEAFLSQDFIKHLLPGDLPVALTWAEQQTDQPHAPFFPAVVDAILLQAWEHLDTPGVIEGFARVALARLRHHQEIVQADYHVDESNPARSNAPFSEQLRQAHDKRQRVLSAALPLLREADGDVFFLTYSQTPLVTSDDVHWLLARFQSEPSEPTQRTLALLMRSVFNQGNGNQADAIFEASQSSPLLGEIFREFFEPMALNSPEAEERRTAYRELLTAEVRARNQPLLDPPLERRIAMFLEASESGNTAAWWRLNLELTLKPNSVYYGNEFEADLTTLPAWEGADTTTRKRVIEAAKRYLQDQNPQTQGWLGDNLQTWMGKQITIHRPAFAGYRAFILLQRETPDVLASLPEPLWKQWAPMLVSYPFYRGEAVQDAHDALMQRAYQYARPEIIETFLAQVDQENKEMGQLNHVHRVESCWDAQLAEAILAKAKEEHLTPDSLRDLLIPLLEHQSSEARIFAESLIQERSTDAAAHQRVLKAAHTLLTHTKDADWSTLWPTLQKDPSFGREVLLSLQDPPLLGERALMPRLTESQIADLFLWLVSQFPPEEDPPFPSGFVTPRQWMADFRNGLVVHLQQWATTAACDALRHIIRTRPELDWVRWQLQDAEKRQRENTWVPPKPEVILRLAGDNEARLVQNGEQLLDVLLESLERLQGELQGETPASIDLWNEWASEKDQEKQTLYRPKDENELSDYIKRFLDRDIAQRGIVANREVELRRSTGGDRGERTDIHIDAYVRDQPRTPASVVTAIIEVKGCWHKQLPTAMEIQLVDRYLKDNTCRYGLYLVGWFNCKQWDSEDYRKGNAPQRSIDEARAKFATQAMSLSADTNRNVVVKSFVLNTALR